MCNILRSYVMKLLSGHLTVCCVRTEIHMSGCLFVRMCLHVKYKISSWEVIKLRPYFLITPALEMFSISRNFSNIYNKCFLGILVCIVEMNEGDRKKVPGLVRENSN